MNRSNRLFTVVAILGLLFASGMLLNGCNTWKGAGEDVESAGEKMQGD